MLAFSWCIGAVFGFEFVPDDLLGGGWILYLGPCKIAYFKTDDLSDY